MLHSGCARPTQPNPVGPAPTTTLPCFRGQDMATILLVRASEPSGARIGGIFIRMGAPQSCDPWTSESTTHGLDNDRRRDRMTNLNWLRRLFESVFWADERVIEYALAGENDSARRYLHHLLAAERVWLLRLRGESSAGLAIWPTLSDAETR